jgi:hypothetical protein
MSFMTSKPHPDIPEKRRHFQPWAIPIDIPQTMRLSLMRWVLIIGVMFINVAAFAALEVAPSSYDFGKVLVGSSSAGQVFNLLNTNLNSLPIGTIETLTTVIDEEFGNVTTVRSQEFIINNDLCSNTTITNAGNCQVTVVFKPKSAGARTATLSIPTLDPNTPTVNISLSGYGTEEPNIEASLTSYDFGELEVGKTSPFQIIMIRNTGRKSLEIGTISLAGDKDNFLLQDYCSNTKVIPSTYSYCTLRTAFKPLSDGLKKATIFISSNDPDTPILEIALSGGSNVVKVPNIEVTPLTEDFGEIQVGSASSYKMITISNTGTAYLQLGTVSLSGEDFNSLGDFCSNQKVRPGGNCYVNIRFEPKSIGEKTGMLSIASDDSDLPTVQISLKGKSVPWCSGNSQQDLSISPNPPDFGTEIINSPDSSLSLSVNTSAQGCGALEVKNITVTGADAAEFKTENLSCYNGQSGTTYYSNCQINAIFLPTLEGIKNVELTITFADTTTKTIPLKAAAVNTGQPNIEISPNSRDFGKVILNLTPYPAQEFIIKNTGNVNLKLDSIQIEGTDKADFVITWNNCSYRQFWRPSEQCSINVNFNPKLLGKKEAQLTIIPSNVASFSKSLLLTGIATDGVVDCSEDDITIETSGSTWDHRWAEKILVNGELAYQGPTQAWKRLQNFQAGEIATPNIPREDDVIRINGGHTIIGIPFAKIKALCIEESGILQSLDIPPGTPLEIQATDYIRNQGSIIGNNGPHEMIGEVSCTGKEKIGTGNCAYPGSPVILKVGSQIQSYGKGEDQWWYSYVSGGPILNLGQIIGGHGGNGSQYAADGGNTLVLGHNTTNKNAIKAGHGGDILGINAGAAGKGGITQIWGKLGGQGSLYNNTSGAKIFAGDGGNCNINATGKQIGGKGGNLWLVSLPDVYISGGEHRAGKGGNKCAQNGGDGGITIEPNIIDLSHANTIVDGGDITIFGGRNWTLDLSHLSGTAITASGDITLAVGEGSAIDMRGNSNTILKADGQVYIFSDTILLDPGRTLRDLIEATNIVVGPNKILHSVSLIGLGTLIKEPGSILQMRFTLANNGPEKDTYSLNLTDTAGWPLSQLPLTVEVEGLETIELILNVTLPSTQGERNGITLTAISQADPTVTSSAEVTVIASNEWSQGSSTMVTPPPQLLPACVVNGIIDWVCRNNRDQVLTNVTIETKGNVAGGILVGEVTNKGIISQVKVQSGAVVNGGKLTGYINNEGTLSNFEFVGAEINGGTLAGTVNNNSKVGGTFKDVDLAANAHIIGGYLQGTIKGDKDAPALLENVTIKSDSLLSGVKLGEGVRLEAKVTCGEDVQAQEGVCPSEIELPPLRATATNAQGEPMMTAAIFSGGISVNQGTFESQATLTIADLVDILGQIQVDPLDLGQAAEAVVYVSYKPLAAKFSETPVYFMLNEKGDILPWNEDVKNLVAFQAVAQLVPYLEVPMYQGPLPATGHLQISFGYRLTEGTVVHNLEPIEVTITE